MQTSCWPPWASINSCSLVLIERQRGTDVVACVAAIFLQAAYTYRIACPTLPALMCHALCYTVSTEAKVAKPTRLETTIHLTKNQFWPSFNQVRKYPLKKNVSHCVCIVLISKNHFVKKISNVSQLITCINRKYKIIYIFFI